MVSVDNYIDINRHLWDSRVDYHFNSKFYNVTGFLEQGQSSLNDIDLKLLGDIRSKRILHLQCHFGMDTLSLVRDCGAGHVTGVDFSSKAIEKANELAQRLNLIEQVEFICCNIYDLKDHLNEQFDIVYTSYGTIGWLPLLNEWADLIQYYLKPDGKFIMIEFHPVVWMFDTKFEQIQFSYFNHEPIIEQIDGTYADRQAPLSNGSVGWNHSLSEVFMALVTRNLQINIFNEYDYSPYSCLENTIEINEKCFRIKNLDKKIPMVYAIKAIKQRVLEDNLLPPIAVPEEPLIK
ncbi:unnamed protein product [Didymodactylos carnosus]|uniref:Methyltransferase domain-containing protein n=1 Tax=Didymodactylos carnosus TaxID=1234261 RepID=A0A8S2FC94_9BILA|nr:unnamed protein product [Didymodactylos carnosus]CAF4220534.1 unnamed protein product [Didymodactylos carnosus]